MILSLPVNQCKFIKLWVGATAEWWKRGWSCFHHSGRAHTHLDTLWICLEDVFGKACMSCNQLTLHCLPSKKFLLFLLVAWLSYPRVSFLSLIIDLIMEITNPIHFVRHSLLLCHPGDLSLLPWCCTVGILHELAIISFNMHVRQCYRKPQPNYKSMIGSIRRIVHKHVLIAMLVPFCWMLLESTSNYLSFLVISDYNPLMGNGGRGSCFRPPRRGGASGGGWG